MLIYIQCIGRELIAKDVLSVLACLGYNKTAQTGWLRNNRNVFLTALEAKSPRSGASMVRFSWDLSFSLQTADFSLFPHMVEGMRELSQNSSTWA